MTPQEKAEAATRLLNEPVMRAVFVDIRDALVAKLEQIPISDKDTQHEITLMLQLLKRFQGQLAKYIGDETILKHRKRQDKFIEEHTEGLARAAPTIRD